jgi:hypothetical protein
MGGLPGEEETMARPVLALSRRALGRILVTVPFARVLRADEPKKPPSPEAEFIASQEAGLSPAELERLKRNVTDSAKPLQTIRDFKLPPDVGPAVRFRALKSRR